MVMKLVIRFWLNHNLHGLKRVRAYSQANLDPESSKKLLVAANIAIDHIIKTVSHLLSVFIVFKSSQIKVASNMSY